MSTKPYPIFAYRSKQWTLAQTDHLVPGDVVSVVRTKDEGEALPVPADMLILQGSCIANEAMLSGESTPQLKESVWLREDGDVLNIDADKGSVVFGGTKVLQVSPPKYQNDTSTTAPTGAGFGGGTEEDSDFPVNWRIPKSPDGGCIATVLRTGFSTQQGKLVRMIIYSTERITANNLESLLFILFLLFFAIIAAGYVWNEGINNPNRKQSKVLLDCILIITSVVPPELPMELSLAVNNSLIALARGYIFCTEPFRIPFAGKIDVACFDKTGTITQENLIVQGLIGVSNKSSLTPSKSSSDNAENCLVKATKIPKETTFVLACAHALVHLDEPIIEPAAVEEEEKGKIESSSSSKITSSSSSSKSKSSSNKNIIGDPMEKNTLDAIDWLLQKGDILSPNNTAGSAINPAIVRNTQIRILRRFAFSSTLKRMSTVSFVNEGGNPSSKLFVAVKGAPETIQGMLTSVPADYEAMYKQWARQGSRVLALGYKWLNNNVRIPHVHDLVRDDVESELTFGGFLIFSCPLKKDSASAIKALNESSHRVNGCEAHSFKFNILKTSSHSLSSGCHDYWRQCTDSCPCSTRS